MLSFYLSGFEVQAEVLEWLTDDQSMKSNILRGVLSCVFMEAVQNMGTVNPII